MDEFEGNTDKSKQVKPPEKQIVKVVTGEVIQRGPSIGQKFKNIFFGGDFKQATRYVGAEIILPAVRNLVWDMISKGSERIIYGDSARGRRPAEYRPRYQYNNPIYRRDLPRDPRERPNLPDQPYSRGMTRRYEGQGQIVLASREDAERVAELLLEIVSQYEVASMADLNEMLGLPSSHIDNKWGWTYLSNIEIRQIRDGYLLELPPVEEI
jgi:hypothetical protein